jgi:hypothetical protein
MYCPRLEDVYLDMAKDINKGKYDINFKDDVIEFKCFLPRLEETEKAAKQWAEDVRRNFDKENNNKKWYQFWK